MERLWAVLVSVAVLVGCRTAQPTTNPFMRTTVPPPATGSAVVVTPMTPGQPALPGVVGPITPMTPSTTPSTMPPAISPALPVAPPVSTPPPIMAPPVAPPARDKYSPPGGSFQYNQSSLERSKSDAPDDAALAQQDADTLQTAKDASAEGEFALTSDTAVRHADVVGPDSSSLVAANYHELADAKSTKTIAPDESVEPPEATTLVEADPPAPDNEIRILKSSSNPDNNARNRFPSRPSPPSAPVFRIVAGQESSPEPRGKNPIPRKVGPVADSPVFSQSELAVENSVTFRAATAAAPSDE